MPLQARNLRHFSFLRGLAVPAAIGISSIALELGGEPVREALRYEREGLAAGQVWRLLTGHLVHLGPSHMLMNVLALGVLSLVLGPLMRAREWLGVGLVSAAAIDIGLYAWHPEILWYVGLSGVLHGFWAGACVFAWRDRQGEALPLTLLLLGKLGYEFFVGVVPLTGSIANGPVVTAAHAWGAGGGVLCALCLLAIRHWRASL